MQDDDGDDPFGYTGNMHAMSSLESWESTPQPVMKRLPLGQDAMVAGLGVSA